MPCSVHIVSCFLSFTLLPEAMTGQVINHANIAKDNFSKAFLYVYKEAPFYFSGIKGKEITIGQQVSYACRKSLPGCRSAIINGANSACCVFDFGVYESLQQAQEGMLNLSNKISAALSQKIMIRYVDSTGEPEVIKRTAMAEIRDDGFYGYNIMADVIKNPAESGYNLRLTIYGGEGIFYRFIHRGEPLRSPFFKKAFGRLQMQFQESEVFSCIEQLPGFTCMPHDSSGKLQLMMIKNVPDFRDARTEMECLTTGVRAMTGDNFLYYYNSPKDDLLQNVVFVRFVDHDLYHRKSIITSLVKEGQSGYVVRLKMYHP